MIIVFAGPSVRGADLDLPADCVLPPAAQGDVYRAARRRPWGIGLIDGVFEHVPAVWHKEVLWALSQGVHVFGAASMGALRAAELADFGMVGIGWVFEQFRTGALTCDDEVALAHLPADRQYEAVSEALVNIRATLAVAVAEAIVEPALAERLVAHGKQLFYPLRSWAVVLEAARAAGDDAPQLAALERWLPGGRVDQKQRDALAMIGAMRAAHAREPAPFRAQFAFQHTDMWERAVHQMRDETSATSHASDLLEELRLLGDEPAYRRVLAGALLLALAGDTARRSGFDATPDLVHQTGLEFRRRHGLHSGAAMKGWMAEQGIDAAAFFDMMVHETKLRWTELVSEPEIHRHLPHQLRTEQLFGRLQARIRAKHAALDHAGVRRADLAATVEDEAELWQWYFARLGVPVPDDITGYARRFGVDRSTLLLSVVVERWCVEHAEVT